MLASHAAIDVQAAPLVGRDAIAQSGFGTLFRNIVTI